MIAALRSATEEDATNDAKKKLPNGRILLSEVGRVDRVVGDELGTVEYETPCIQGQLDATSFPLNHALDGPKPAPMARPIAGARGAALRRCGTSHIGS